MWRLAPSSAGVSVNQQRFELNALDTAIDSGRASGQGDGSLLTGNPDPEVVNPCGLSTRSSESKGCEQLQLMIQRGFGFLKFLPKSL
jgi:hypothetical protein